MAAQKASARVTIRAQSAFLSHGNEPTAVSDGCSIQINRGTQRRSAHRNLFGADHSGASTGLQAIPAGRHGKTSVGALLAAAAVAARDVVHPQQLAVLVEQAHPTTHDAAVTGNLN